MTDRGESERIIVVETMQTQFARELEDLKKSLAQHGRDELDRLEKVYQRIDAMNADLRKAIDDLRTDIIAARGMTALIKFIFSTGAVGTIGALVAGAYSAASRMGGAPPAH